jgi:hypothetical protein
VIVDTLTGEYRVTRVDILHDVGRSLNPAIDIGQIEGGFVQGMGWLTTEELVFSRDGRLLTHAPSTYKIPVASDVPADFNVTLYPNSNREETIYRSKAVGEPPIMLANSVFCALADAVHALDPSRARAPERARDAGGDPARLRGPAGEAPGVKVWRQLSDFVERHKAAAFITVHEVKGSAPREKGARMVVRPDGAFHGTIGGGSSNGRCCGSAPSPGARARPGPPDRGRPSARSRGKAAAAGSRVGRAFDGRT